MTVKMIAKISGPKIIPRNPKAASPPKMLKKTNKGWIFDLDSIILVLIKLSDNPITITPQTTIKIANPQEPEIASIIATGTHTKAVPTIGIKDAMAVPTPKKKAG